jgi:predicted HTH transcriptional regulator
MSRNITITALREDLRQVRSEITELRHEEKFLEKAIAMKGGTTSASNGTKRKYSRKAGNTEDYKRWVYNALSTEPRTVKEIAEIAGVSNNTAGRHLDSLVSEGKAKQANNAQRYRTYCRTEVRIKPGNVAPVKPSIGSHA